MKKALLLLALLAVLGWLGACKSVPTEIPPDLSPADYFQKAQEASDGEKYELALKYYRSFLERYPEERDRGLWARYEIALLHSKMKDSPTALRLLDELLALYAGEDAAALPQGPRILAEKIKAKLLQVQQDAAPEEKTTQPPAENPPAPQQ
jgi:outer membrane protein assembly factor BamD (BamD/ComL family)